MSPARSTLGCTHFHRRAAALAAFALIGLCFASPSSAQTLQFAEQRLLSEFPVPGENFGLAVSVRGDLAAVSALGSSVQDGAILRTGAGSVYLFRRANGQWQFEHQAVPQDPIQDGWFGMDVALSDSPDGEILAVGSPFWGPDQGGAMPWYGALYIFRKGPSGWFQQARIPNPIAQNVGFFGFVVAAGPNVCVTTAPQFNQARGAFYVYRFDGTAWGLEAGPITPPGAIGNTQCGEEVALDVSNSVERILVSAAHLNLNGTNSGSAFIYRRDPSGWVLETAPSGLGAGVSLAGDAFGLGVSLDGNVAAVGAPGRDAGVLLNVGHVNIFRFDGVAWSLEKSLSNPSPTASASFGRELIVSGDQVVVGAPYDSDYAGAAYSYRFDGSDWVDAQRLTYATSSAQDYFGSIAFDGENALVGAYMDDVGAENDGGAYAYRLPNTAQSGASVQPVDELSGAAPATLTFGTITSPGTTTLAIQQQGTPPPAGFKLGNPPTYFEISSTATFAGLVQVCVDYSGVQFGNENQLSLLHYENGNWIDVTASRDAQNDVICGQVSSFSPFLVAEALTPVDSDGDGLFDGEEVDTYHTDPLDTDTDDDGLLDGTEVDMAEGSGCPSPTDADSDDDTLLDGAERTLGTSPCKADSDADSVPDAQDPLPLTPGVTSGFLELELRQLAQDIAGLGLADFAAPNDNARSGRRNALSNRATGAANLTASGNFGEALDELQSLLEKLDGLGTPPDWLHDSPLKASLAGRVQWLIGLLELM